MDEKRDRYLLVHVEMEKEAWSSDGIKTGTVDLKFVTMNSSGKPRNFDDNDYPVDGDYMDYLTIRAYWKDNESIREAYGWSTAIRDCHRLNLERARAIVKTLSKIERKLKTYEDKWGYLQDFTTYLIRVANAMDVKGILVRMDNGSNSSYDYQTYRTYPVSEAGYALETAVAKKALA